MRTPLSGRRIGPHLPLGSGLLKAAERAVEIGATAVQVFTDNPIAWRRRSALPVDLPAFRSRLAEAGIESVAVHAPYLVNLCGANDDFRHRSVDTMANELRVAQQYGARYVVMHIGSHGGVGREHGIDRLARGLADVLAQAPTAVADSHEPPLLVLENSAGTGDGIGATLEDIADILAAAVAAGVPSDRLGVCLDTAHLWAAGYEISDRAGIEDLVDAVDSLIGRRRVVALHLNDSRTTRGSRLDRHEHIGAGKLGPHAMRELLCHPWMATLPTYLETPGMDSGYDGVNLERVRLLLAGEPLPELPPEAFQMRGSRTRTAPPNA